MDICLCLQGVFDRWNDGTLLTEMYWYDPTIHGQKDINLTVQTISDNTFKRKEYFQSSWKVKQPDSSIYKNCTAAVVDANPSLYIKWFVIPCEETYISTYTCSIQKVKHNESTNFHNSNLPCTDGWFRLNGVSECYMTVQSPPIMTFKEAENQCSIMNSSLLDLESYERKEIKYGKMSDIVKLSVYEGMIIGPVNTMALKHNLALSFLYHYCFANDAHLRVLVTISKKCAVAEYSKEISPTTSHWIANFCGRYIQADTFICVKPSESSFTQCDLHYYQCLDGTCVLTFYTCDSVTDCVTGEDETNCPLLVAKKASLNLQNDSLYLPCPLYHSCNSSESLVTPVKLHTICDGIINPWLSRFNEHGMCIKRNIDNLDLHSLIFNGYYKIVPIESQIRFEKILQQAKYNKYKKTDKNITGYVGENGMRKKNLDFKIQCVNSSRVIKVVDMCQIIPSVKPCGLKYRHHFCKLMLCPGMFRCRDTYCIYMSSVCDGQSDCPYGEDEAYCSYLTCPGFLKCRGESRCISPQQICDGHVDCISSFDDEIHCNNCPRFCKCDGYILKCILQNTLPNITNLNMVYSKAYIFSGVQSTLSLDVFESLSGIFLDISGCEIQKVVFDEKSHLLNQHLLFFDFSNNELVEIKFLLSNVLSKVIVLDLSDNYITLLTFKYFRLSYLIILYIRNNPLTTIELTSSLISFKYVDLQNVVFNWEMKVSTTIFKVEIAVTNSILCCLWPKQLKCVYEIQTEKCYGLINNSIKKIIFLSLVILAIALVTFVSTKTVHEMMYRKHKKRNFNTSKLNFMVSSLLSALSLAGLSVLVMTEVNIITWRRSIGCHIINAAISLSLGTMFVFKTTALFLVAMKIMFPFAHQCRWVNKTYVVCSLTWLTIVLFYSVNIIIVNFQIRREFDKFCTICDCHIRGFYRSMYYFICSVDLFCLVFFIAILWKTIIVLKAKAIVKKSTFYLPKIIFGFMKQVSAQLLFTCFLYSILLIKTTTESIFDNYCFAVFLFVLPLVIIVDSILGLLM